MSFSEKRFVDIGQTIYTTWLREISSPENVSEDKIRESFSIAAKLAFIAAEEFAKVFDGQECNKP